MTIRSRVLFVLALYAAPFVAACSEDGLTAVPNEELEPLTCPLGAEPEGDVCPEPGTIAGMVCDHDTGSGLAGVTASVIAPDGTVLSDVTDAEGSFTILGVPPGDYYVHLEGEGYENDLPARVTSEETTAVGSASCTQGVGAVHGRICGSNGLWLAGARVYVELGGDALIDARTDSDGWFTLAGVPGGAHTVQVAHNAFSASFAVTVEVGVTTELPEPVCIPPTTRMAVVTGIYDQVELVLADLGFPVKDVYDTRTPTTQNANGNVDIIKGTDTFYIEEFLSDPAWMAQYKIIFFNCGIDDWSLVGADSQTLAALRNVQDFVSLGGSIYVSDWASEIVRLAFPGRIDFYGSEGTAHAARVGDAVPSMTSTIVDGGLALFMGGVGANISFDLSQWVVMQSEQSEGLQVFLRGDAPYSGMLTHGTITNAALIVQFDFGEGRVLFTSAHTEAQTTPDLERILKYIIFEL